MTIKAPVIDHTVLPWSKASVLEEGRPFTHESLGYFAPGNRRGEAANRTAKVKLMFLMQEVKQRNILSIKDTAFVFVHLFISYK